MKFRRYLALMLSLLVAAALLTGCGAAAEVQRTPEEAPQMANDALTSAGGPETVLPENRKWVVTIDMQAETEDLDQLLEAVFGQIRDFGGYVEDQNIHNGTAYAARRYRSASLTVRIPAEKADEFTRAVGEQANVVYSSKNLEDITLTYVDNETRLAALKTEEARLLELMEQAETMSDLLEIESRLTDVHYEMERITAQLRTYDNQVDYATIYLNIEEVVEYTPVEEPTVGQRIVEGFKRSLVGVGEGLVDLVVWILAMSPYLVVWGLILFAVILMVKKLRKGRKKKAPKHGPAAPDREQPRDPEIK